MFATGTENSGVSLFIPDNHLVFDYNSLGDHTVVSSDIAVPVGASVVGVQFERLGRNGAATLVIDGEPCGRADIALVMRMISSVGTSVGADLGSAVSEQYRGPFAFTGTIRRLDIQLAPERARQAVANAAAAEAAENARQ